MIKVNIQDSLQTQKRFILEQSMISHSIFPSRSSERHDLMGNTSQQLDSFRPWIANDVHNYCHTITCLGTNYPCPLTAERITPGLLALDEVISLWFDRWDRSLRRHPELSQADLLEVFVNHFVSGSLPISHVDAPFFRGFARQLNLIIAGDLPNSHELKSAILRQATVHCSSVTDTASHSRFVTLMAHGVWKGECAWSSVCLTTADKPYL
jgi:hypothetical protein